MDAEQLQNDIDALLVFMNDELEKSGATIEHFNFAFNQGGEERITIDPVLNWQEERLFKIIRTCNSRRYLINQSNDFSRIRLTEEGQGRALSVKHGKSRSYELNASKFSIATLNVTGPAQIGDGNILNVHDVFQEIISKIDNANATPEEITEAKSRLAKFLEHPLTAAVLGGAVGSISGLL